MKTIKDVIKVGEYKKEKVLKFALASPCPVSGFSSNFIRVVNSKMVFTDDPYIIDERNKDIINSLYAYLTQNTTFDGDLFKGILLIGNIGNGKTIIMESFVEVFNAYATKIITSVGAKDIPQINKEQGYDFLWKRPVFIDDIGKEQTVVNTFGTVSKPMEDLINERYKNEALTFGTSNLKLEDLPYNSHTIDRIKQMFNIIILPGKSRRK